MTYFFPMQDADILATYYPSTCQVAYILSLGVVVDYRKHGIGLLYSASNRCESMPVKNVMLMIYKHLNYLCDMLSIHCKCMHFYYLKVLSRTFIIAKFNHLGTDCFQIFAKIYVLTKKDNDLFLHLELMLLNCSVMLMNLYGYFKL